MEEGGGLWAEGMWGLGHILDTASCQWRLGTTPKKLRRPRANCVVANGRFESGRK